MTILKYLVDLFLHIDKNLVLVIQNYGMLSYAILFGVVFMETGFVITPFLPGDSLLFAAGALAAIGSFNVYILFLLLFLAAFLGDTINYWIGHFIGPRAFSMNSRFLKKEYLDKATNFYEKHGGKAIILARFVPIVRTFAPFVAGVGKMNYWRFIWFNFIGGLVWVALFVFGGFYFGNFPIVKANFHYVVVVIIAISIIPIGLEFAKAKMGKNW
ncbi:MAG: DedA family protein [Candidatus Shapirobacteria bacterium]|nr:DedA family protein [Candidatus Shapirobacteria bacterium]